MGGTIITGDAKILAQERGLHHGLSQAQVVMIGLGGAIGTGLFMGSGLAIGYAGPAVLVSYAIAGFIAVVMVLSLSEMAVMHPTAGSFGAYAEIYLNPWSGYIVRYSYWFAQVIAVGGEAIAAGTYMTFWFPDMPIWIWSLGFAGVALGVNLRAVGNFGSVEYGFSLIKVTAIVLFIILGIAQIVGWGDAAPVGLDNLWRLPGGFMPHGVQGLWMAVILGFLSYNGIEVIAVTSGEVRHPEVAIPRALRSMAVRLLLFYLLALGVVVTIIPWTETGARIVTESPFVRVFSHTGIAHAAGVMNFVVISAALSSMNTNIYLCSRMLFSLSRGDYAPAFLGRLGRSGTPLAATLLSGGCILLTAAISKLTPLAYNYLQGVALFGAIIVWITILLSHLQFRRRHALADLKVRTWGFPILQIMALLLLAALLITMGLDTDFWDVSWIVGVPWLIFLSGCFAFGKARRRKRAMLLAHSD